MTIFSPGAGHDTFTVDPGEIVYVPKGYLHHIENINHGETKFAIAFNHESPEDIGISGSSRSNINNDVTTYQLGSANNFGILSGLACYLLTLKPKGIREPHWHPNAAELDYVISGRSRMTIFSPGDKVDTFEVGPGEIVFIPSAYFHYIENVNASEDMQFAVFFNHERPEDIGISGAFGAYSNEVLGSIFGLQPKILDALPKYQEDLFVVAGA
jgi:oxalate decarboxylase